MSLNTRSRAWLGKRVSFYGMIKRVGDAKQQNCVKKEGVVVDEGLIATLLAEKLKTSALVLG
jgi:hypothetical protein